TISQLDTVNWGTYRALCKRRGIHTDCHKVKYNVNQMLCEPLIRKVTVPWGTFFQNEISSAFDSMLSIEPQLTTMLDSILPKFQDLGLGDFQKSILRRQIKSLTRSFKDKCAWIVHKI